MSQSTFLERLRMLYKIIGLLVVFAAILVAFASLPELYRRMRDAKDTNERNYFALELAATWCFIYPVTMLVMFAVAPDRLQEVWPTISWILFDWDMSHQQSVAIDIALSIFLCPMLMMARCLFGSSDVDGTYHRPERERAQDHIDDVMSRYRAVLSSDPRLDPSWPIKKSNERDRLERDYQARLLDIEDRVRTVHQMWGRKSPI